MKAKTTKADDAFRDIQGMWKSLYKVGDEAIARMKAAATRGDRAAIAAAMGDLDQAMQAMRQVRPVEKLAFLGRTFRKGRKPNSGGPIRRAIARMLKHDHDLKPRTLWAMLADNPPRGWTFCDNRVGKYAEGPRGQNMSYGRFQNVTKEERDKLK